MIRMWTLPEGLDTAKAPPFTVYDAVYAPNPFCADWIKVRFMVVIKPGRDGRAARWHQVMFERRLNEAEIERFCKIR